MPSFSSTRWSGWPARRKRILLVSLMSLALILGFGVAGAYALFPQLSGNARSMAASSCNGEPGYQQIGQTTQHDVKASELPVNMSQPSIVTVGTILAQLCYNPTTSFAFGAFSYMPQAGLPTLHRGLCFITKQNIDPTQLSASDITTQIHANPTEGSLGCPLVGNIQTGVTQGLGAETNTVQVSLGDTWKLCWSDSPIQDEFNTNFSSQFTLSQPQGMNQSWCSPDAGITISTTSSSGTATPTGTVTPTGTPTTTGTPITTGTPTSTGTVTPTGTPTSAGTPTTTGTPTASSGTPAPTVGSGTDPASLRQDCHTDIIAQGATPPYSNLPYSYPVGSPWLLNMGSGTLTGQLYYCPQENSVFGVFSVTGTSTMGSCSLKANYGATSTQRNIPTVYNKTSPYVYGTCSNQATISPDNSGSRQQQTMLGETYSGDTWQLCWATQCSLPINPFA